MKIEFIKKISSENYIIGAEKYFKAAVGIPLFNKDGEIHILFEKRAAGIRQGGEVSLPGGECELFETNTSQTAIRESSEELGIELERINYLGKFGFLITPFGALIDVHLIELLITDIIELNYDKSEVDLIFSLPLKYFLENEPEVFFAKAQVIPNYTDTQGNFVNLFPAKEFNLPEKYHKPWGTHRHRIFVYKTKPEIVWGITAEIIFDFSKKIKGMI